jgi:hypothetical protein
VLKHRALLAREGGGIFLMKFESGMMLHKYRMGLVWIEMIDKSRMRLAWIEIINKVRMRLVWIEMINKYRMRLV